MFHVFQSNFSLLTQEEFSLLFGLGIFNRFAISPDLQPGLLPIKVNIEFSLGDNFVSTPSKSSFFINCP